MSVPPSWPNVLDFFGTPLVLDSSPGQRTSDAGLLPVRPFDQRRGLTRAFADALDDPRDRDLVEHTFLEMVRSRVYGILAGYEDQNDHNTLRADPRLQTGRRPLPRRRRPGQPAHLVPIRECGPGGAGLLAQTAFQEACLPHPAVSR
jgi:hypothetical protein